MQQAPSWAPQQHLARAGWVGGEGVFAAQAVAVLLLPFLPPSLLGVCVSVVRWGVEWMCAWGNAAGPQLGACLAGSCHACMPAW